MKRLPKPFFGGFLSLWAWCGGHAAQAQVLLLVRPLGLALARPEPLGAEVKARARGEDGSGVRRLGELGPWFEGRTGVGLTVAR